MKLLARPIMAAVCLFTLVHRLLPAEPLPRSISASRQFIIYGTEVGLRGAVADLGERTKADLLTMLQARDEWKTPIIVNLQFPQANLPDTPAAELHFSQTGSGLKLQLDLTIAADVNARAVQRELLRAVLLELIYRNHPDVAPGTVCVQAPDWLLEATLVRAATEERETLMQVIASSGDSDKRVSLQDFLRQSPRQLDAPTQLLYRAYASALLQVLLDGSMGPSRLAAYINDLSNASNDPLADLRSHFPILTAGADDDAMWKSAVEKFASVGGYQLLTFGETRRQLDELVHTRISSAQGSDKSFELESFAGTKVSPAQAAALNRLSQRLLLLSTSAHPVMRPIVVEYQQIAQQLAAGKRARLGARLARLRDTRSRLGLRMTEIDDYMNWYEATQLKAKSGAFVDYLKAADQAEEPERRRRDALSVYLDAVEAEFQN